MPVTSKPAAPQTSTPGSPPRTPARTARRIAIAVALSLCILHTAEPQSARAALPGGVPTFSDSLRIDHAFLPIVPGAVKVFSGRSNGESVTIVESHSLTTRTFAWNDQFVECRVVEELVFDGGALTGEEQYFLAQADDGSVWAFGEIEDSDPTDDGGNDGPEPGGWIVGQLQPTDPPDVTTTTNPALYLPAMPQVGDVWHSEDAPPSYETTLRVRRTEATARTTAGRFRGCLRLIETDVPDGTTETRWFAPGLGQVRTRARGEQLSLRATSLRAEGVGGRRR